MECTAFGRPGLCLSYRYVVTFILLFVRLAYSLSLSLSLSLSVCVCVCMCVCVCVCVYLFCLSINMTSLDVVGRLGLGSDFDVRQIMDP